MGIKIKFSMIYLTKKGKIRKLCYIGNYLNWKRPKKWRQPKNEDDLKNEPDFKNEDNHKDEDNLDRHSYTAANPEMLQGVFLVLSKVI